MSQFFDKKPGKAFWYATEGMRGRLFAMYVLIVLANVCGYSEPYFIKLIVDKISASTGSLPFSDLSYLVIFAGIVFIAQEVFYRIGHYIEMVLVIRGFDRVTTRVYETILRRPAAFFEETFSGELGRRVEQIGSGVKYLIESLPWDLAWQFLAIITSIVLLAITNVWLLVAFLAWLVPLAFFQYFFLTKQSKLSERVSDKHANLSGAIVDVLGNTPLVHSFAAHAYESTYYRRFMNEALSAERAERKWGILNKFHQGISIAILPIIFISLGAYLYTKGLMTVGDFVVIAAITPSVTGAVWNFGETIIRVIHNHAGMKSALESLDVDVIHIEEGKSEEIVKDPEIRFSAVSFAYNANKEEVIEDLGFAIKPGEKVGLVGKSGAGKSTVVKLLLRMYDPQKGAITIGNKNVRDFTLAALRNQISFVPQDTALFHRTLFENIQYAKPAASREEVIAASKRAHAHDFIEKFPNGYETKVGERGVKLSGGQRQRIALARAMLKNSPVLVLDEATSALDTESEEVVQKGLEELFKGRTVLAIAHRLSTLRSMDRIIVLDKGKIIEDGSPQELLAKKESVFKTLWEHQKNGFV